MQKTPNDIIIFLLISTLLILIMGGFILTILFLYRKKQLAYIKEREQMKLDFEKNLLSTQLEIQEQTFQTISREIHDNINLSLTLAKLNLNTIDLNDLNNCNKQVQTTVNLVGKAIADLTDISRSLNSDVIIEQGLISALQYEIDRINSLNIFRTNFEITGSPVFLCAQKELFIFRIIQEAFNNILKHAKAKNVTLLLDYKIAHLNICVLDDGLGFINPNGNKKTIPSAGLKNMQKRAEILNGSFEIQSIPGLGTQIKTIIPLTDET